MRMEPSAPAAPLAPVFPVAVLPESSTAARRRGRQPPPPPTVIVRVSPKRVAAERVRHGKRLLRLRRR